MAAFALVITASEGDYISETLPENGSDVRKWHWLEKLIPDQDGFNLSSLTDVMRAQTKRRRTLIDINVRWTKIMLWAQARSEQQTLQDKSTMRARIRANALQQQPCIPPFLQLRQALCKTLRAELACVGSCQTESSPTSDVEYTH